MKSFIDHVKFHIFFASIICGLLLYYDYIVYQTLIAAIGSVIFINPDVDKKISFLGHRDIITHSVLLPAMIYYAIKHMINVEYEFELQLVLYLPILLHLVADFKLGNKITGFGLYALGNHKRFKKKTSMGLYYFNLSIGVILLIFNW